MKIKKYFFLVILIIIALVAITLRLTHTISSTSFGFIGLIFAIFGFIRSTSVTMTSEEKSVAGKNSSF
ncbi:hypothetical protein WMZ97_21660 [Lentibacillus sp. N15]|uniref:hypothetical protein n=1 Tax=Lentibacillus songyuanensis TaxID=3136161 RepID=UPI0031BBB532